MKKQTTKALATGVAGAILTSLPAHAVLWDDGGVGSEFSTPENWDGDLPPTDGATDQTADINGVFTVERSVDATVQRTFVQGGATLNVTGGTHSDNRAGNTIRNFIGNDSTGTVAMTGGSWDVGHINLIGSGDGNGNGTFLLSGGSFTASRGGNSFMGIAGGSSLEVGVGSATGLFEISGTSTLTTRIGVGVGSGGTFHVLGSSVANIGIGSNGSLDGSWNQATGGILRLGIDSGGITPILIDVTTSTGSGGGNAIFQAGSILDPYDLGGAAANVWTTVMTWEGALTDDGLALSTDATTAGWEKRVDGSDLQVRLVPEPSVALLGGLGLLGLLRRRRA